ncbi:MAG: hypothetical protein M0P47_12575 [Bacteroidales bacterium]|nr:hypothetical protein [Bacteroidales bacterium]
MRKYYFILTILVITISCDPKPDCRLKVINNQNEKIYILADYDTDVINSQIQKKVFDFYYRVSYGKDTVFPSSKIISPSDSTNYCLEPWDVTNGEKLERGIYLYVFNFDTLLFSLGIGA